MVVHCYCATGEDWAETSQQQTDKQLPTPKAETALQPQILCPRPTIAGRHC